MPRLSRIQQQVNSELKAHAASALLPNKLASQMLASLEKAIGWDGYRLFGVDSRTLLIDRLFAASDNDGWARREWLQEVYLVDDTLPYIQLPTILKLGLRGVAYQDRKEISWGYPSAVLEHVDPEDHSRYFFESRSPVGGVLLAGIAGGGRWVAALQAYRRDPGRPFAAGDVEFLRRSGSVIGSALSEALVREQAIAKRSAQGPTASGVALVNAEGDLTFASPAGHEWIEVLRGGESGREGLLPTPLWSAMLGLRRGDGQAGHAVVRTTTPVGPVTIEATPADLTGGMAIVISQSVAQGPPDIPAGWPLTDQQRQVTRLIVEGRTNQQIAESLFVSEHTVEWHVRQIFDRLDLRSRTELAARYFRESMLSTYHDPDVPTPKENDPGAVSPGSTMNTACSDERIRLPRR